MNDSRISRCAWRAGLLGEALAEYQQALTNQEASERYLKICIEGVKTAQKNQPPMPPVQVVAGRQHQHDLEEQEGGNADQEVHQVGPSSACRPGHVEAKAHVFRGFHFDGVVELHGWGSSGPMGAWRSLAVKQGAREAGGPHGRRAACDRGDQELAKTCP